MYLKHTNHECNSVPGFTLISIGCHWPQLWIVPYLEGEQVEVLMIDLNAHEKMLMYCSSEKLNTLSHLSECGVWFKILSGTVRVLQQLN